MQFLYALNLRPVMQNDRNARMILLAFVFIALINYPLLSMFDKAALWFGSARLYVYLFFVWLLLIVLTARSAVRR